MRAGEGTVEESRLRNVVVGIEEEWETIRIKKMEKEEMVKIK